MAFMPSQFQHKALIAAIDIGTSNCKTMILDETGRIHSFASVETPNIYNRLGPGWVEHDAEAVWKSLCETTRMALASLDMPAGDIRGIGVTTYRQTVLPLDEDGRPIRLAIPWCIKATTRQSEWIREHVGEGKLHYTTGVNSDPHWVAATFRYLVEEEPDIYRRAFKLAGIQDFLLLRLGSQDVVIDAGQASAISLLDLRTGNWSKEICDVLGVNTEKLPRVVQPGSVVGSISKTASEMTGFAEGTPLVIGGGDCQCSAIGCGAIAEGTSSVIIGTTAVGLVFSSVPTFDPHFKLVCHNHSYPGAFMMQHTTLTGGSAYRWFRDVLYEDEMLLHPEGGKSLYEKMNEAVVQSPVGSNGLVFLPHFVGAASPYWNDRARGVFIGIEMATRRRDLARALIEGVVLELGKGFSLIENLGKKIAEVRLSGGTCSPGSPWNQIQADVFGKPVKVNASCDTTSIGAAILAGAAVGVFSSIDRGVEELVHFTETLQPNLKNHAQYKKIQAFHDMLYRSLDDAGVYERHQQLVRELYGNQIVKGNRTSCPE
jgi:xylulokinase